MEETTHKLRQWLGSGSINIFGRPFSGKDTQGEKLTQLFGGVLLGGGEILRASIVPEHVAKIQAQGGLVPSEDYVNIVLPYLGKPEFADRPLILSSLGRWIGEEVGVIAALETSQHPLKAVIYLDIDEDIVLQRWHALASHNDRHHRADDTLEVLDNRLEEYRTKTLPVIEKYDGLGLLIRIDGTKSPDQVFGQILHELTSRVKHT